MLQRLAIRDFVLITELEMSFSGGMTVLTGETGAGKSILIDALSLVLGDRADAGVVRHGQTQAEICASFEVAPDGPVARWLAEQSLREDGEIVLRRVIGADGRSRAWVNGSAVALASLREVGALLVDIHGQHEHQRLLSPAVQRQLLDEAGRCAPAVLAVRQAFKQWQQVRDELSVLQQALGERDARLDLLRFQVQELEAAGVEGLDVTALEQQHRRAANAAELAQLSTSLSAALDDDEDGAAARLLAASERAARLAKLDPAVAAWAEQINEALAAVQELAGEARRYGERIEIDDEALVQLDQRLASLHQLARKHRIEMAALPDRHTSLSSELQQLQSGEASVAALEKRLADARQAWQSAADGLSQQRRKAAANLAKAVSGHLAHLGMAAGRVVVELSDRDSADPHPDGAEKIEWLVAANAGQPPRPLAKTASGGELSRISLAIQVVAGQGSELPCLIFDEVDVGIGGGTAEIVGQLLRKLATRAQVLCVTHQPQVAAQGHQHVRVQKRQQKQQTHTELVLLGPEERVDELARMVGGVQITDTTRAHARELLQRVE